MDCDDIALLLASGDARTLSSVEEAELHDHVADCQTCRELADEASEGRYRWVVRVPEDALDDADLLVLPTVDPVLFSDEHELSHGGMGRITRAHDRRLGREVAIKEVLLEGLRARFEREVQITAKLQHPAIVPVYEAGVFPNGSAFYTMRLVLGGTLSEAIARAESFEDRLALLPHVIALTDALAYAHSRRIVHRDLKPGNVLVGEFGETVVIDWGLAKELDRRIGDGANDDAAQSNADLTAVGAVMGTPGFMAPEQAAGEDVDERADVYALGTILYAVLAGRPPYSRDDGKPTPPLVLVAMARQQPPQPLGELEPRVPPDLQAIVERAMARDPAVRFASAKQLAEELHRFEAGQLLRSRQYSLRELIARWLRRHRTAVIVAAIAAVIIAVVGSWAVIGIAKSRNAERDAREQAEGALARSQLELGRELLVGGHVSEALPLLEAGFAQLPGDRVARWLVTLARRDERRRLAGFPGTAAAIGPDGHEVAIGRSDGSILVIDAATGAVLRTLHGDGGAIGHIEYAPDSVTLAVASTLGATLRSATTGAVTAKLTTGAAREARFISADRVGVTSDDALSVFGTDGQPAMTPLALDHPHALAVSPDGTMLLVVTYHATVVARAHDLSKIAELPFDDSYAYMGTFDHDGGVITGEIAGARRWSLSPVREIARWPSSALGALTWLGEDTLLGAGELIHPRTGDHMEFAHDLGISTIAALDPVHPVTGGYDRMVRIWDIERSTAPVVAIQAAGAIETVVAAPNAERVVSVGRGADSQVELWDATKLRATTPVASLAGVVDHVITDPDGRLAVHWHHDNTEELSLLDRDHHVVASLRGWPMAFRPQHAELVTSGDRTLRVWSAVDGHKLFEIKAAAGSDRVAFSPSGMLAVTSSDRHVELRDADNWRVLAEFDTSTEISATAVDDADHIVTGHADGTVRLWRAHTGVMTRMSTGHAANVDSINIRGHLMWTGSWDGTMRLWSFPSGEPLGTLKGVTGLEVVTSPDGQLIATVDDGKSIVKLWDAEQGRLVEQIPAADALLTVAFIDSRHVITGGRGGRIELVDLGLQTP